MSTLLVAADGAETAQCLLMAQSGHCHRHDQCPLSAFGVTAESLKAATADIGATQAELRDTHLKYHLQTAAILSAEQMQHYSMLRGYGSTTMHHHHDMQ